VKSWDAIIIGGGIIGLALAISLRKKGLSVLVLERGRPGQEASSAAAGMLVGSGAEMPPALKPLAADSAKLYPEFVHALEDESCMKVDLREQGTILISSDGRFPAGAEPISIEQLGSLDPVFGYLHTDDRRARPSLHDQGFAAAYLEERSVDPRVLVAAALQAARHRGVDVSSGTEAKALLTSGNHVNGVETDKSSYTASVVVNCAGAWSGCVGPVRFPVRPIKGQMLAVVGATQLRHVVRSERVYLVPRGDGRVVIGSTVEDAGYDKRTDVNTIQQLFHAALELTPGLAGCKVHEDWAGLRPGTPDGLPIMGETSLLGYFVATGHYRDGILLAPITAQVMTGIILNKSTPHDLAAFSASRFR
jgi:glycine oxidase